jgi:hypothetical protein
LKCSAKEGFKELSLATWLKQSHADTASVDGTHMQENLLNISAHLGLDGFVPFYCFKWLASVKSTHIFLFYAIPITPILHILSKCKIKVSL